MSSTFGWSDASASQASQAWSDDASAVSLSRASEASSGVATTVPTRASRLASVSRRSAHSERATPHSPAL